MVKSKMAALAVPELFTITLDPAAPVSTSPTVIVAAAPGSPLSPFAPAAPVSPLSPFSPWTPCGPWIP